MRGEFIMRRNFGALCAILIGLAAAGGAGAQDGRWTRAESEHFVVYSDTSPKMTSAYLYRLEQYRYILSRFHGYTAEDDAETPKISIYFVSTFGDLKQTWPEAGPYVGGYYKDCIEGQAAVAIYQDDTLRSTRDAKTQDENASQAVLFHEYAHTFMFQNSAAIYPQWFVEGYAEYYSTTKIAGDTAIIGMGFSWRVQELLRPGGAMLTYADILTGAWRPKKEDTDKTEAFYAQSWLLTHYLMSDTARQAKLSAYIAAYDRGDDPVKAFETAFGIPVKTLDKTLNAYLDKLMATEYRIHDMPDPQIKISAMPRSANKLLLWDAADRLCPARADGAPLLDHIQTEAARYPDDDYAQMALARAEIIIGDEAKALPYLTRYTAAHPDDSEGWFRLGQAWYLTTAHRRILSGETRDSQMKKARQALAAAYRLDPRNAPNLYYYALSQAVAGGDAGLRENAVNAAMQAHYLAPSVEGYAIFAARLLINANRSAEAKTMLYPLASNPHQPELAARIRAAIDAIDRGAPANEIRKLLSPKAAPAAGDAQDAPDDGGED
jgi:hypothetical protein